MQFKLWLEDYGNKKININGWPVMQKDGINEFSFHGQQKPVGQELQQWKISFKQMVEEDVKILGKVLGNISQLIPQNHRPDIQIYYQPDYKQRKDLGRDVAGEAGKDYVMIYRTPSINFQQVYTQQVLAHEIGHTIFAKLTDEEKQEIVKIAQSMNSPSAYGKLDYVYPALKAPAENHTSGNEWFAEVIARVMFNPVEVQSNPIMKAVKSVFSSIGNWLDPDAWRTSSFKKKFKGQGEEALKKIIQTGASRQPELKKIDLADLLGN